MKRLFICSNRLSLFNIILINEPLIDKDKNSDLIIFTRGENYSSIVSNLIKLNIFSNVSVYKSIEKKPILKFLLFALTKITLKFLKVNINNNSSNNLIYDEIYSQNFLYASLFAIKNKNADIFLIEEGLSSYTGRVHKNNHRFFFFKLFNQIIFKGSLRKNIKGLYLHKPNLLETTKDIVPIKINFKKSKSQLRYLKNIFNYKSNIEYHKIKFIYLGLPFFGLRDLAINSSKIMPNFEKKCQFLVEKIFSYLSPSLILYRTHPLEITYKTNYFKNNQDNVVIDSKNEFWEIQAQELFIKNRVIISFFSSAAISPKIIFDQEPYVVFLQKLLGLEMIGENIIIKNFKKSYSEPNKVFVPSDVSELLSILDMLNK